MARIKEHESFKKYMKYIMNSYSKEELNYQKYFLNWLINYIHEQKGLKKSLKIIEGDIKQYTKTIIEAIQRPTLKDFYVERTANMLIKNDKILELHVETFLKNNTTLDSNISFNYSEDMDKNINLLLDKCVRSLFNDFNCITPELKALRKDFLENNIDKIYIRKLSKYIYDYIKSKQNDYENKFYRKIEHEPEILTKVLLKNVKSIFDVQNIKKEYSEEEIKSMENFIKEHSNKDVRINKKDLEEQVEEKVTIKEFQGDPLYSQNNLNNALLYLYKNFLLQLNDQTLKRVYKYVSSNKKEKEQNWTELFNKLKNISKGNVLDIRTDLSNRIYTLVMFLKKLNLLEKYNYTNNNRLHKLELDELQITDEELEEQLTNRNKVNSYSIEALIGLSAFYSNRVTKSISQVYKSFFILTRLGLLEKIYNNDDYSIEDLDISEDKLKEFMARYDLLESEISLNIFNKINDDDIQNNLNTKHFEEIYIKSYTKYIEEYEIEYPKSYRRDYEYIINDVKNIKNCLYKVKTDSIQFLIYTAIMDENKNILNWGYIEDKKGESENKILLGFDIRSLNMPIRLHIKTNDFLDLIRNLNEYKIIPMYLGKNDINVRNLKMTTQILTVLSKNKKRELTKITKSTCFLEHLKWLQKPHDKSKYIKEMSQSFYNIEDKTIMKKEEIQNESFK